MRIENIPKRYCEVKRIMKKNQIMITTLALLIAVAGYLNFAGINKGKEDSIVMADSDQELTYEIDEITEVDNFLSEGMDVGVLDQIPDTAQENTENVDMEVPGEAIFTSSTNINSLSGAKLLKEQTRAKNKETLLEIINNENLSEDAKQQAVQGMIRLTDVAQKETDAEILLETKGFAQSVVCMGDDSVDVMINASSLTDAQTAQILDIVQRKTEVAPEKIIITLSKKE